MSQILEWSSNYAIGDPRVDNQHEHLFRLANQAARLKDSPDKEELQDLLFKLYAYVEYHFEDEEDLMAKRGYPKLEEHRESHQAIIRQLNVVMKTSRSIREMTERIFGIMSEWVAKHILDEDSDLKSCMK